MVGEDLARRLVRGQFPDLEAAGFRLLGEGWDVTAWLVDGRHVFRFPRRAVVVPGLEREIAVLPRIAPLLPLPVPVPVFIGRPAGGYPWPFFGAAMLPGSEIAEGGLAGGESDALASALGGFLRRLHSPEVLAAATAAAELPADPMARGDMAVRVPRTREVLERLREAGVWAAPPAAARLLEEAAGLPAGEPSVLVHGDLHLRHLLVDRGRAAAVIDWIDVGLGSPGVDLVLYWSLFDPAGRRAFLAEYGAAQADDLMRARVLALNLCGILALYAREESFPKLEAAAVDGLERTLSGSAGAAPDG